MTPDTSLLQVLNEAVNAECGALFLLPQHLAQIDDEDTKRQLKKIEKMELKHAERLAELIARLGETPRLRPPRMRPRTLLIEMLEWHIKCEKKAIETFRRAEQICQDPAVCSTLADIRREEELHLRLLKKIVERVK